jgi:hypothetical protein
VPPRATPQLVVAEGLEPSASGFGHPRSSPVSYATLVEPIQFNEMVRAGGFEPPVSCSRNTRFAELSYTLMKMKTWRSHGVSIPGLPVDNRMLCL